MQCQQSSRTTRRLPLRVVLSELPTACLTRVGAFIKAVVVVACVGGCWQAIAGPILDQDQLNAGSQSSVLGWANGVGSFVVDNWNGSNSYFASCCSASYSAGSSLFSLLHGSAAFVLDGINVSNGLAPADVEISAIVQGNGSITGNLLGGILTVRAGSQGIAGLGAAPGETLLVGHAIDSAALPALGVSMLFDVTYAIGSLSAFGDYLTYVGAYSGVWGVPTPDSPWGRDWSTGGWTFDSFLVTHKVSEPATGTLMLVGCAAIALLARRRRARVLAERVSAATTYVPDGPVGCHPSCDPPFRAHVRR